MSAIVVWFRNDLRVHDHPALATAISDAEHVVPVFIFDSKILKSSKASANRNRFLLECLEDLKQQLVAKGGDLLLRDGQPEHELLRLAKESDATAVYYTADFTPFSIARDKQVKQVLEQAGIGFRAFPGRLAVSSLDKLNTKVGNPHKVFTPFWKNWQQIGRRDVAELPVTVSIPSGLSAGNMPKLEEIAKKSQLSPDVLKGGETEARKRLKKFLNDDINDYLENNNNMGIDATSRLSSYLHYGCLSVREIETMLPHTKGAAAWHRQLAWREFYHYVLFKFPSNTTTEFQERYRKLKWGNDAAALQAWQDGQTGYPIVDAAMRQLKQQGWIHNRGRLIVGSFLTKDLWLDWRLGETHFMNWLIDGDMSNNNGNWQWIASVGVDPAPVFRRMYNPSSQQKNYDPDGTYIKKYVPELKKVPLKYLGEPWKMSEDEQREAGCVIGKDYPMPIVNHAEARLFALEQYRSA